jgi:hypothetical protein
MPVIVREVVAREMEGARHVSLLEEDRGASVEDECPAGVDGSTEFFEPDGRRRRDLKRGRRNQSGKLRIEALLGRLIDDGKWLGRKPSSGDEAGFIDRITVI